MYKPKVVQLNVFTDEWKFLFLYSNSNDCGIVVKELFPEIEPDFFVRGLIFYKKNKVPLIWINSTEVKDDKQKILTTIHESYHLVELIGSWINIKDEEWFAETQEYVVKQIIKKLKIKL